MKRGKTSRIPHSIIRLFDYSIIAIGSWKFWLGTALAAGAAAAVAVFTFVFETGDDAGTRGYKTLGGDRVLLMNGDTKTEPNAPITRQGWGDKTVTYDTYWTNHGTTGEDAAPGATVGPMLQAGTHFELWTKNAGRKLWELINCRQGNLFPNTNASGTTGLESIKNYLPYSTLSSPAGNQFSMQRRYAGQIVMRNTPDAQVVSSCYADGIGTIYVDAVNGFTGSPSFTDNSIAIEVAYGVWKVNGSGYVTSRNFPDDLETVDGTPVSKGGIPVPPDDAHCDEVIRHADDDFTTNRYERCAWVKAKIRGVRREGGTPTEIAATDVVKLDITTGGTMDNFYRLWAPIQDVAVNPDLVPYCNGPLRFRIKRQDSPCPSSYIEDGDLDGKLARDTQGNPNQKFNALILLDNVIASLPAMKAGAVAKGEYVTTAKKRNTVGWTGALSVKYPAVGETGAKASAGVFAVSNNPPAQVAGPIDFDPLHWVTKASMKYRWRYFERIVPETWEEIELQPAGDGLESIGTMTMPELVGDVEFYYSAELDAPYYAYVDYSGSTTITGTPGYRERIKEVQTRLDPEKIGTDGLPKPLPSAGTDFFFRLREGKSDQLGYVLEMRRKGTTAPVTKVDFTLSGTRAWRAYYQTLTNGTETAVEMEFRIVGENPGGTWGEKGDAKAVEEIPWSGHRLVRSDSADSCWTSITVDALTGYLMFQVLEDDAPVETMGEMSYSIVHADVQDFTHWGADATRGYFVGTYEDTTRRSGDSPAARDFTEDLALWSARKAEDPENWSEKFVDSSTKDWQPEMGYGGYKAYVSFPSVVTPNGWESGPGQWVCGKFHDSAKGGDMALQMMGQGFGSLTYQDTVSPPNGLDTVKFRARSANYIGFGDFAVCNGGAFSDLKNYMFTATVAMANKGVADDNFDGNGTVSLTAYHMPNVGCYEVRAERIKDGNVRLWLYKWAFSGGQVKEEKLGYYNANLNYRNANSTYLESSGSSADDTYAEMFIYCKTISNSEVEIYAGIANGGRKISDAINKSHWCVKYVDKASPYTSGTYGFGVSSCYGRIISPLYYAKAPIFPTSVSWTKRTMCKPDNFYDASFTVKFDGAGTESFELSTSSSLIYKDWSIDPGRFEKSKVGNNEAVRAKAPSNTLKVEVLKEGSKKWEEIGTTNVASFAYEDYEITLHSRAKSSVRFRTGGDVFSPRTDIVIDDVALTQWCAANFNDADVSDFNNKLPGYGCPTNFVYVNGWVNVDKDDRHSIDLQPTRAQPGVAMGVRGPLMDGEKWYDTVCGLGLGSLSYTYANADSRCRMLVQWKDTKGSASSLASDTKEEAGWITVATNDFSKLPASGTVSTYVGLRGVTGVMRLVVDPQVVRDANDPAKNKSKDPKYGMVTVERLLFRDEPPMDDRCWWGWNLQARTNAEDLIIYDLDATVQGRALALNDSVERDISPDPTEKENYKRHVPFVQSPKFAANVVGEISFRVRKMSEGDPDAQVTVLAALNSEDDDQYWTPVYSNVVDSTVYKTCTWKAKAGRDYAAFRVAVVGVDKVDVNYGDVLVTERPVRILLDDVVVSEAIRGKIGLFDVGAFRKPLDRHEYVPNLFDVAQQPMCEESWSVQCEVRATQLAEEIRLDDTTQVILHWYRGDKWGYGAWQGDPKAKSAPLARIAGQPGFVFRGSYPEAPGAVVEPIFDSGAVVQYMLEVRYLNADGSPADPYYLSASEWKKPSWYRGVDYNASRGGFAAYTILDTVAYGYAWINEVNVYDGPDLYDKRTNQFVEVAVPSEANIKGWMLQFVTGGLESSDPVFYTNTVVTFTDTKVVPDGVPCEKTKNMDPVSKYVFITAGNPKSVTAETKEKGFIDGAWHVNAGEPRGQQLTEDGLIDVGMPIGIRLLRPSGIVEHEIVVAGTNRYATYRDPYPRTHSATNFVAQLNRADPNGTWYTPWCEDRGTNATLAIGVTNFVGAIGDPGVWRHLTKTPGRINAGELIPYDPGRKPQGSMFVLYAQLKNGSLAQTVGMYEQATENLVLYVPKGLPDGTNITYDVAAWHEIASVTETEDTVGTKTHGPYPGEGKVTIAVGKYASNDVTVVATSRMREDLATRYKLTEENPYTPAVLKWLEAGTWGKTPQAFANQGGEIKLAKLHDLNGQSYGTDEYLSLTDMYWFDMDPTLGGIVLQSGFSAGPTTKGKTRAWTGGATIDCEDMIATVKMFIRSENGDFATYAPYTLNGRVPGTTSRTDGSGSWDGPTFKITAHLNNGQDAQKDPDKVWMPVRYFYFGEGSFDENFEAEIQVVDPYYQFMDWYPWKLKGIPPPWYRFYLDDRKFGAVSSEVLRPDSTFDE